ncbi:multidrug ABC transporter ATP-binding protein [Ktedonobacter sp. SOSP1-52]|uniref:ABC transporter ATP-binding protein n=1 Tax=Ktedonobacter sp. SOSP1-52 TaxID=2778366 RepID=UPI00191607FC|nr:ABC transporter ATP-binding protein [Ktedonobacter sp. SOSP1-52]GHO66467.1 multidrug ABC transporter ATP-binding protein [Ktedonobacter sp. SOSP1-52]
MDTRDIMIEACELSRIFGKKLAVDGVSLSARRGEIFGLLGPNGAGKTTTIRILTGQIEPSGGEARVAGYDVVRQRRELKQVIGVVFEEQNLYERLSARLNLEVSCWLYGLPKTRVDEVLDLVRLRDRAKDPVRTFSNGMKQRVMIARALLHRPRVLFLDEPSRGLDPIAAREVRQAVRELCQEGMTILLTTHLMEEADQLCHRVAFINNGHIVANDTPRNLKLAHGEPTLTVTLSQTGQDEQSLQEQELSLTNPADQAQLETWMREGLVRAIHSNEASLEDVFIQIAGVRPA